MFNDFSVQFTAIVLSGSMLALKGHNVQNACFLAFHIRKDWVIFQH
jgi:hypothetical protein